METFSDRLRSLLAMRGISQKNLADAANLTQGAISKYLNGHQEPKSRELYSISKVLNVPMESWFGDCLEVQNDSDWKARAMQSERKLVQVRKALKLITEGVKELESAL